MANNQGYNAYGTGTGAPHQHWQQSSLPQNPALQNWTAKPEPVVSSNTAPAFYTAAQGTGQSDIGWQKESSWQQDSGWHKGGSLHGFDPNVQQHQQQHQQQSPAYYVPSTAAAADQGYGPVSQQDFSQDNYKPGPSLSYPVNNSGPSIRFPQQSPQRPQFKPQPPQAQVFKMANQHLMSRMVGRGRGQRPRAPWPPKVGTGPGQKPFRQKTPAITTPALSPMQILERKNLVGLVWDYRTSEGETPVYIATVSYLNNSYKGTGRTKKDSTNDAAKYLLQHLGDIVPFFPEEKPAASNLIPELYQLLQAKKCKVKLEFTYSGQGTPFTCSCVIGSTTFSGIGPTKKSAKSYTAQRIVDAINTNLIDLPVATAAEISEGGAASNVATTPLGELNLKLGSSMTLDWHLESFKSNTDNVVLHTAAINFLGHQFVGQDASKKGAKNSVALQILQAVKDGTLIIPEAPKKSLKRAADSDVEMEATEPASKQPKSEANMNPISRVNQYFPGSTSWTFDQSGPPHAPEYTAFTVLQNQTFSGTAGSKKEAKTAACNAILEALTNETLATPTAKPKSQARPQARPQPMEVDISATIAKEKIEPAVQGEGQMTTTAPPPAGENPISEVTRVFGSIFYETENSGSSHQPLFVTSTNIGEKNFSGSAGTKKEAKLLCCQSILAAVESGELLPGGKAAVAPQAAAGQLWPDLVWTFRMEGNVHKPVCYASTVVDGTPFEGTASSKKASKHAACRKIMDAVQAGTLVRPQRQGSIKFSLHDIKRFNKVFGTPQIDMENVGTEECPQFNATTTIEDRKWAGTGGSVEEAMASVIKTINEALQEGTIEVPILVQFHRKFRNPKVLAENIGTEAEPVYQATFVHANKTYTATSMENAEKAERDVAKQALDDFVSARRAANENLPDDEKTPISLLNEKSPTDINIDVKSLGLKGAANTFVATAVVDGQEFQGSGKSKMQAKHNCAAVILVEVFGHQFNLGDFSAPQTAADMQRGDIGGINHQALSTKVQGMVSQQYSELITGLEARFHGRKVLAGCVLTRGDDLETAQVLSVASGTKCIHGGSMSHNGKVVNDLHAEILVRRALKKYLYKQIELIQSSQPSVLTPVDDKCSAIKYRLADGIRFHLYISSPPCGDSRIFTASTLKEGEESTESTDSNPNRANRGQLRVKMETGQGTVPVNTPEYNKVQSWDGIMAGDRYLNMSCCDKVARWGLLGFQGSLLGTLIQPVYFSSVIISSMFNQSHIYRGVFGRIRDLEDIGQIAAPFRHHCPEIIGTVTPELRNTVKPPGYSIVWQAMDGAVEVLNTKSGLSYSHESSSLCKKMLYKEFRKVNAGSTVPEVYGDAKNTAVQYQTLKKNLYAALEAQGLGKWIGKPVEQDQFTDKPDDADDTPASANQSIVESSPSVNVETATIVTPVVASTISVVPAVTQPGTDTSSPAITTPELATTPSPRGKGRRGRGRWGKK